MSCNNTTEKKTMFINSYKVDCVGVGPMQCLQIKYAESEDWSYFYDGIDGFDFEPGYIYQIDVSVDTLDTATLPADKSNLKYSLLNIVSKRRDMTYRLNDIWVVTHMMNKKLDKTSLRLPQLEFSLKNKKVIGTDGCNNVRGSIRLITDTELEFGPMMGTKKLCPQMDIPNTFNTIITEVRTYKLDGLNLLCFDKNNKEIMRCLKVD
jgi:heat shock protein HslJ